MLLLAIRNGNYYNELKEVTEFYKDNFNKSEIEIQLEVFGQMKIDYAEDNITFINIKSLPPSHRTLI